MGTMRSKVLSSLSETSVSTSTANNLKQVLPFASNCRSQINIGQGVACSPRVPEKDARPGSRSLVTFQSCCENLVLKARECELPRPTFMLFAQGQPERPISTLREAVIAILIACRNLIDPPAQQLEQGLPRTPSAHDRHIVRSASPLRAHLSLKGGHAKRDLPFAGDPRPTSALQIGLASKHSRALWIASRMAPPTRFTL
jgi:hypothetical protein